MQMLLEFLTNGLLAGIPNLLTLFFLFLFLRKLYYYYYYYEMEKGNAGVYVIYILLENMILYGAVMFL
jgi:hypothetical protein